LKGEKRNEGSIKIVYVIFLCVCFGYVLTRIDEIHGWIINKKQKCLLCTFPPFFIQISDKNYELFVKYIYENPWEYHWVHWATSIKPLWLREPYENYQTLLHAVLFLKWMVAVSCSSSCQEYDLDSITHNGTPQCSKKKRIISNKKQIILTENNPKTQNSILIFTYGFAGTFWSSNCTYFCVFTEI